MAAAQASACSIQLKVYLKSKQIPFSVLFSSRPHHFTLPHVLSSILYSYLHPLHPYHLSKLFTMADQRERAVPRCRAPTTASTRRARVPSNPSPSQAMGSVHASRPSACPVKRVQTPHPRIRSRVASDSSDSSAGSSHTSQQSVPRFQASTMASGARSRVPSNSSICSTESTRPSPLIHPPIRPPPPPQTRPVAPTNATNQPSRLAGHLAGMAAKFQENSAKTSPAFARPTAASAARVNHGPSRPIIKRPPPPPSKPKSTCRVLLSATTRCLMPWRKPHVDKNTDKMEVQPPVSPRPHKKVHWDEYVESCTIPKDKVFGKDVWDPSECSGLRPVHDFVQNMYLQCVRPAW